MTTERIAVIGAGAAGLVAAISLAEAGRSIVLFEASARVGGRIHSLPTPHGPVELGAEFLHGRHPALMRWVERAGLDVQEMHGTALSFEGGEPREEDDREQEFSQLEALPDDEDHDISFGEWARQHSESGAALRGYVEGFNAADADLISCAALVKQQRAEDEIGGGNNLRIVGGYAPLVDWWQRECERLGIEFRLRTRVIAIAWERGSAQVTWDGGEEQFTRVICAVPLPLLQNGVLQIKPMTEGMRDGLSALVMGNAMRVTIAFENRFWMDTADDLSFLIGSEGSTPVRVFWTAYPGDAPLITAWVGGPQTEQFATGDDLFSAAIRSLAQFLHHDEAELREKVRDWYFHDWQSDPLAMGAYCYVRASGLPASRELSRSVENTLYFAGEHTDSEGHWGTVHAAVVSGERAARQVLGA